jgi:hypothetical protein
MKKESNSYAGLLILVTCFLVGAFYPSGGSEETMHKPASEIMWDVLLILLVAVITALGIKTVLLLREHNHL